MRREDLLTDYEKKYLETQSKLQKNHLYKYWIELWKFIYNVVTIGSYIFMITGLVFAFYYSIVDVSITRVLVSSALVLLSAYVNRINPK